MKHEITAQRLREALNNANIIPAELAAKSGVSQSSISQYLSGSHAPSNISSGKMAAVLHCNPVWLMGFDVSSSVDSREERTQWLLDFMASCEKNGVIDYTAEEKQQLKSFQSTFASREDYLDILANAYHKMNTSNLSASELEHIRKYKMLDEMGRHTVDVVVDMELERMKKGNVNHVK